MLFWQINGKFMKQMQCEIRDSSRETLEDFCKTNVSIFDENLVGVKQIKEMLTLNKPSYVGACIMDLSKSLMHNFRIHNGYFLKKYDIDDVKLLFNQLICCAIT